MNLQLSDKADCFQYHWYVVRSLPHQEQKLKNLLLQHRHETGNILEVYCPVSITTESTRKGDRQTVTPIFAGFVFVLATQRALMDFLGKHYADGTILYDRNREGSAERHSLLTIPESQMSLFKAFNENYVENAVVLEVPFSHYAFNKNTDEPNEIVKVVDGPLKGRQGYLVHFRRDKRLVLKVDFEFEEQESKTLKTVKRTKEVTFSIPNSKNLHLVRLHNAEGDRQTLGTKNARAVDQLIGLLQACGYGGETLSKLYEIVDTLVEKPSLTALRGKLDRLGEKMLADRIARYTPKEAELLMTFIRYEHDNPGYLREHWHKLIIRPFLTPTSGVEMGEGGEEAEFLHADFTEIIRRVQIEEQAYIPTQDQDVTLTTIYYAHIGRVQREDDTCPAYFANWDTFLEEYYLTADKAHKALLEGKSSMFKPNEAVPDIKELDKLEESFRNQAPTLYKVLTDARSVVRPVRDFKVGNGSLNVLAVTLPVDHAKELLIDTCTQICTELNSTVRLAVWRRYLRTVWLHE